MLNSALVVAEKLLWWIFLLLLVVATFIRADFSAHQWMWLAAGIYLIVTLFVILMIMGQKANLEAIQRSRFILLILVLMLCWWALQTWLPWEHVMYRSLGGAPDWFRTSQSVSVNRVASLQWLQLNLLVFFVLLLAIGMIYNRSRARQFLFMLCAIAVMHAGSGIAAKYANLILVEREMMDGHWTAARGWFVNRNHFAALLLLCLLGSLPFVVRNRTPRGWRLLHAVICVLVTLAIVLSQSRAGIVLLAFMLLLAFALPYAASSQFKDSRRTVIRYLAAVIGLALGLLTIVLLAGEELLGRLHTSFLSLGERIEQWQLTLQAIWQSPWVGYGGGSYEDVFQWFRGEDNLRQVVYDQSHNDYLHIWLETGLLGLILWLSLLFLIIRYAYTSCKASRSSLVTSVQACGILAIAVAMLQSLVDFNLQIPAIRILFFACIGLLLAMPTIHTNNNHSISRRIST